MPAAKPKTFTEYRILPERKAFALRRKMLRRLLKLRSKSAAPTPSTQSDRAPDYG